MGLYEEYLKRVNERVNYTVFGEGEAPKPIPKSKECLFKLVRDFTDRRGLRQEFDQIDDDIKDEILETWLGIIETFVSS